VLHLLVILLLGTPSSQTNFFFSREFANEEETNKARDVYIQATKYFTQSFPPGLDDKYVLKSFFEAVDCFKELLELVKRPARLEKQVKYHQPIVAAGQPLWNSFQAVKFQTLSIFHLG
jgi:hypothetical protein